MRVDTPPVAGETEALFLMTYHLRMAAAYFEATPEIYPHNWSATEFSESAMECWLQAMEALYPKD